MKRPFDIVFEEFDDHIVLYAVAHTKRKPGYWLLHVFPLPTISLAALRK